MEFYKELGFEYLPVKGLGLSFKKERESAPVRKSSPEAGSDKSDKAELLKMLREEIGDCRRCRLCEGRKNIVFGEGSADAELMFVGEGPGKDEDIQGRPFVGEAGQILNNLINKRGWKREEVYIANIVKCRPPGNRAPEDDEVGACMPFVERQIEIIRPKVIMALGNVATQSLLRIKTPISRARGNFFVYKDIPVMPTFHPAYFLRNPKEKILTWEDSAKVLEKLNA
ncbi:MAG: uracil-DNA glycosylase [Nitrospirae bacterium]|nr:uracil-DNA glycosylase [Nitrospirota bacterium]